MKSNAQGAHYIKIAYYFQGAYYFRVRTTLKGTS